MGVIMQGLAIKNTVNSFDITFDKNYFDEVTISNWLKLIEMQYLSKKVDFDEGIFDVAKEIKSSIWKKEKNRLGLD